jgi:RHS repeat-associated protein
VIHSAQDYLAFGALMQRRRFDSEGYRYGFNGKENDNEVKGSGNQLNFGARIYDPRVGRYLSVDPLHAKHADMQPYHHATNNPVNRIDPDGNDDIHFHYATRTVFMPDGRGGSKPHTQVYSWATVVRNNLPNTFAVHHHSITINQNGDRGSTYTERVIPFHPEAKWPKPRSGVTASTFLGITVADDDYTSLLKKLEDFPEVATKYPPVYRNPDAAKSQGDKNADFMWGALRDSKARAAVMQEREQVNSLMLGVISVAAGELLVGRLLALENRFVYRAIRADEAASIKAGQGISSKNPAGSWSLEDHLIKGSSGSSWANDPWISTTSDLNVARSFNSGNGIIRIDLSKLPGGTTTQQGWMTLPRSSPGYHYSIWQQETSILGNVPQSAISVIK